MGDRTYVAEVTGTDAEIYIVDSHGIKDSLIRIHDGDPSDLSSALEWHQRIAEDLRAIQKALEAKQL